MFRTTKQQARVIGNFASLISLIKHYLIIQYVCIFIVYLYPMLTYCLHKNIVWVNFSIYLPCAINILTFSEVQRKWKKSRGTADVRGCEFPADWPYQALAIMLSDSDNRRHRYLKHHIRVQNLAKYYGLLYLVWWFCMAHERCDEYVIGLWQIKKSHLWYAHHTLYSLRFITRIREYRSSVSVCSWEWVDMCLDGLISVL